MLAYLEDGGQRKNNSVTSCKEDKHAPPSHSKGCGMCFFCLPTQIQSFELSMLVRVYKADCFLSHLCLLFQSACLFPRIFIGITRG